MIKTLKVVLLIFPWIMVSQELKLSCCTAANEVESILSGHWKKQGDHPDKMYNYQFEPRSGTANIWTIKDGSYEVLINSASEIKVLHEENGFAIEYDWGELKTYSGIKYLDADKLIVTGSDGKESTFLKVKE